MKRPRPKLAPPSAFHVLDVLSDLMQGGAHSRGTVARAWHVSLPTADRWLLALERRVPGISRCKIGKVAWFKWARPGREP